MQSQFVFPMSRVLLFVTLACSSASCTGDVSNDDEPGRGGEGGEPPGEGGAGGEGSTCGGGIGAPNVSLPRLSGSQLRNATLDSVAIALQTSSFNVAVQKALDPIFLTFPADVGPAAGRKVRGTYRRMDQSVVPDFVAASYRLAQAVGEELTQPDRLSALLGDCVGDSEGRACVSNLIKRIAPRILRRPLTASDETFFMGHYDASGKVNGAALARVLGILFASPDFLYLVESGTETEGARTRLNPYEVASRLSFHLWNTVPDNELWAKAEEGDLLTESVFREQVDRMLADPRANGMVDEFVTDWLLLQDTPNFEGLSRNAVYKTFAGDDATVLSANVRQDAINDVLVLARELFLGGTADASALMTDRRLFVQEPALAKIYGVSPWNGQGSAPESDERPGLLTRIALLAVPTVESHPIVRGVFVRTQMLGEDLPLPPDNATAEAAQQAEAVPATASTRERVTAITESNPRCAGCHKYLINPPGYALEEFDSLGRKRDEEIVFDSAGKIISRPAINSQVEIEITELTTLSGAKDLANAIVQSGKLEASLARQYFRYTHRRRDQGDADECHLGKLQKVVRDGTLLDFLREGVLADAFVTRVFE